MVMSRVKATLILLATLFVSACTYDFPLSGKQGLRIDPSVLGLWEEINNETVKQKISISATSESEYLVHMSNGTEDLFLRGYPLRIAGISLVQLVATDKRYVPINEAGSYLPLSYKVSDGDLVIKLTDSGLLGKKLNSSAALREAFIRNKDNPRLFSEPIRFRKINPKLTPLTAVAQDQPESDYYLPGAISLLDSGRVEAFPDDMIMRKWVVGFNVSLGDLCQIRPSEMDQITQAINVQSYILSSFPKATQGVEDAETLVRKRGCDQVGAVYRTSVLVMGHYGGQKPEELDFTTYAEMASPKFYRSLGLTNDNVDIIKNSRDGKLWSWQQVTLEQAVHDLFKILRQTGVNYQYTDPNDYSNMVKSINASVWRCAYRARKGAGRPAIYQTEPTRDAPLYLSWRYYWDKKIPFGFDAAMRARLPKEHQIFRIGAPQNACPAWRPPD
jgi:hypothetical protein